MTLLLASIAALVTGPLAYRFARRGTTLTILDGFVFVAISGLVILSVLPEAIVHGGATAIVFIVAGFVGPTVAEHLFHRAAKGTHVAALVLGLVGLCLHALIDGAALGDGLALQAGGQLPAAVVLHRLPVGLAIWWLLRPHFGTALASLALAAVAGATAVGYAVGPALGAELTVGSVAWFQAFVGGSLLHVVFFRPHLDAHTHGKTATTAASRRSEGVGALIALALLAVILLGGARPADADLGAQVIRTLAELSLESAPALLLAFFAAGFISVFMPSSSIEWMARGGNGEIKTAREPSAEILTVALNGVVGAAAHRDGALQPIDLQPGATLEEGPDGHRALMFDAESWAEMPPLDLDTDTPFSLAMWIYMPEDEGSSRSPVSTIRRTPTAAGRSRSARASSFFA